VQLLICRLDGTSAVVNALEEFLTKQGYQVVVADTVQHAVAAAQTRKPTLAFIPSTADQATETLELMQKLSMLGIPAVLINGDSAGFDAAKDKALARVLSRLARRVRENGNGERH
jgi:DNA-binding NtrC family response regulator